VSRVKAISDIATVTMKTDVHPDHRVLPDQLALTANTAQMAAKVPPDRLEVEKDSNTKLDQVVAKNARMDPKDPTDPPDPPDQLDPKVNQVPKAPTANQAVQVQPVLLVMPAQPVEMVNPDPKVNLAVTLKPEAKDHQVPLVKKEAQVQLAAKETTVALGIQDPQVPRVPLDLLAKDPKTEPKDPPVPPVPLAAPARMPNTARAHIVRRKHKLSHHRISPNTILGQEYGFDNDYPIFQHPHHLKIIVSIMLFICNCM